MQYQQKCFWRSSYRVSRPGQPMQAFPRRARFVLIARRERAQLKRRVPQYLHFSKTSLQGDFCVRLQRARHFYFIFFWKGEENLLKCLNLNTFSTTTLILRHRWKEIIAKDFLSAWWSLNDLKACLEYSWALWVTCNWAENVFGRRRKVCLINYARFCHLQQLC